MVTSTGAADPVLLEGRLFFNALAGKADPLRSVDVFDRDSSFEWGIERMVEGGTGLLATVGQEYDVFHDGERVIGVFSESPTQAIQPRVRFVQNWFQILNERAPASR
jgi:hypothetical protein